MPQQKSVMGRPREHRPVQTPLRVWWEALAPDKRPLPEELADRFGCSRSTAYGLLDGTRKPSLDLAVVIESRTDGAVPASAWARRRRRVVPP